MPEGYHTEHFGRIMVLTAFTSINILYHKDYTFLSSCATVALAILVLTMVLIVVSNCPALANLSNNN